MPFSGDDVPARGGSRVRRVEFVLPEPARRRVGQTTAWVIGIVGSILAAPTGMELIV